MKTQFLNLLRIPIFEIEKFEFCLVGIGFLAAPESVSPITIFSTNHYVRNVFYPLNPCYEERKQLTQIP